MVRSPRGTTLVEALVALVVAAVVALPVLQAATRAVAATDAAVVRRTALHHAAAHVAGALAIGCPTTAPPPGADRTDTLRDGAARVVRRHRHAGAVATLRVDVDVVTPRRGRVHAAGSVACD
ncbi:MAG: prepilin-type N-terminal cleavage/methylation domain-containing protein [Gemmatimonadaceae bacterium]|nr:prepilin-type N-terminal cleavage/methylation domain-containing protein [Gemmatimonadaceae bacterium]